jgi:nitric oxide synthase-interacting protein
MKPCAHVTCKTCTDKLTRPSKQCTVCDQALGEKDIVELKREGSPFVFGSHCSHLFGIGTGFAGGGLAETSKAGIAFQG